jgi:type II secretory pathway pseudopilin PulG
MMKFNKGAMFGLDARIALAIFGALSVISGAALYSAIESAQLERIRQYYVEIVKATEHYYLENGQMLSQSDPDDVRISGLVVNVDSLPTWNGPYIGSINPKGLGLFPANIYHAIWLQPSSAWAANANRNTCAMPSNDCAEWHTIYVKDPALVPQMQKVFAKLDELIDGGDGELAGKMRYSHNTANATAVGWVMYKGLNHPRTI